MYKINPRLPRGIWILGFVSLLMDTSSEIVHGLLPAFLILELGASYTMLGMIEGFGEAIARILKVFSGPLSDWTRKRKPLVLFGYSLSALSKPLFALSTGPILVLGARLFDRMGKGIRGAPRDALIADITPRELRGEAYGLRQSLDTVGAFLGPLLAIFLMSVTNENYRLVFWWAVIPGVLSVLVLWRGVREPKRKKGGKDVGKLSLRTIGEFTPMFWIISFAGAIFQLARISEAFLILRAQNLGLPRNLAPSILIAMNAVYCLSAYPIGKLSDRLPRKWMIVAGFATLCLSDLILGFSSGLASAFLGVLIWGLHLGLTEGTMAAMVADHSPARFRGLAYGLFNLFSAGALIFANALAGILWDKFGPRVTFFGSAALSFLGILTFFILIFIYKPKTEQIS